MALVPSEEQQCIVDETVDNNVIVMAVPGSGKTTTILSIIDKYIFDEKLILVVTYNSRLRKETIARVENLFGFSLNMPQIHTFHSYAMKTWGVLCNTDEGIRKIINENLEKTDSTRYDMVIVDEAQDITNLYYQLFMKTIDPTTQIVMLGDIKQAIYQFNGADSRFLLYAGELNKLSERPYSKLTLSISYRLSKPIADFVNNCVIFEELIKPSPLKIENYPKPVYMVDNFFHKFRGGQVEECHGVLEIIVMIKHFLDIGYTPSDIFILGPSIKAPQLLPNGNIDTRKYPTTSQCLVWSLLRYGIQYKGKPLKIFVPSFDDAALDDDIIADKIVFCTFHRSKGLERKVVFILGFDESYEKFYNKNGEPGKCSNPMYVAITRSAEHLILLHHFTRTPLSFIESIDDIKPYVTFMENKKLKIEPIKKSSENLKIVFPSDITRHVRSEYIINMCEMFKSTNVRPIQTEIVLPNKHKDDDNAEFVAEINSYLISLLHNMFVVKDEKMLLKNRLDLDGKPYKLDSEIIEAEDYLFSCFEKYGKTDISNINCSPYSIISKLVKYCTYCCGINNGYLHKFKQIKNFNWMKKENAIRLLSRLDKVLSTNCEFETKTSVSFKLFDELRTSYAEVVMHGRTDIIDNDKKIVWEIKCVQALKDEHFIQLALYKYMHMRNLKYVGYKYYLFNIRTGEVHKIDATLDQLVDMVRYIVDKKYTPETMDNDENFIKKLVNI